MANELARLVKTLQAQGFTVTRTAKNHLLVRDPDGKAITTLAGTPSDWRSTKNAIATLKRAGLRWPPGPQ
jgi:predicted RNA binding protein YcfA (HicA-like mRNA interferase family)